MSKLLSTNAKQKMFTLLQWLTLLSQEGVKHKNKFKKIRSTDVRWIFSAYDTAVIFRN